MSVAATVPLLPAEAANINLHDQTAIDSSYFWTKVASFGWTTTNESLLESAERQLLFSQIGDAYKQTRVEVEQGVFINTVIVGSGGPAVALIHGFGGGVGTFIGNVQALMDDYTVYLCDLVGFGRSSRPVYAGASSEEAENFFIDRMELWFEKLGLDKVILAGHSFGAYCCASYTIKYPKRVQRLLLLDAWGIPKSTGPPQPKSLGLRAIVAASQYVKSPFTLMRFAGPWGKVLFEKVRPDLANKFNYHFGIGNLFSSYVYHCNAQAGSGEHAFTALTLPIAWADRPLVERFKDLPANLDVFFIYGRDTWMDYNSVFQVRSSLPNRMEIVLVPDAGHHVYIDNYRHFNMALAEAVGGSLQQSFNALLSSQLDHLA
eukprot:TRINITY_DN7626_c0_g1_i1.p1 TRINITY_DN7626_c0_g1~~TRINITY_DN7626_c0_g1_i1.p1  ORF type:complete len:375 (+),score=48.70 TRINITY_DN7626_c0_g1_i1:2-1126(+)